MTRSAAVICKRFAAAWEFRMAFSVRMTIHFGVPVVPELFTRICPAWLAADLVAGFSGRICKLSIPAPGSGGTTTASQNVGQSGVSLARGRATSTVRPPLSIAAMKTATAPSPASIGTQSCAPIRPMSRSRCLTKATRSAMSCPLIVSARSEKVRLWLGSSKANCVMAFSSGWALTAALK